MKYLGNCWSLPLTPVTVDSEKIIGSSHDVTKLQKFSQNLGMAQERQTIWGFVFVLCVVTVSGSNGKPNVIIMLMDDVSFRM